MATESTPQAVPKFGTFLGVYTPSVLTILGLIMYLRFGWVVGNVGLPITLLIVLLASSITFITALSASAVATNMHMGVGGEYYLISRSLGLELGGAIGIPLFLCRTLSITFYSFGLVESIVSFWPNPVSPYEIQLLAALIPETRIQAETEIIVKSPEQTFAEVMHAHTRETDVAFLGMKDPQPGTEAEYARFLNTLASGFPSTIFVRNAGEFAGNLI